MKPAYVSIRQHSSAFVSIRQHTPAYASIRHWRLHEDEGGVTHQRHGLDHDDKHYDERGDGVSEKLQFAPVHRVVFDDASVEHLF